MTEIVTIPSHGWNLHGIVHVPAGNAERRHGVVLLHENINTKFGTHRLFWQLADALAQAGFFVLRYDNRGTCDSPGICDLTFPDRVADCRAALDFFRCKYHLDSLLGWGLCMGAAVAVHAAAEGRQPQEGFDGLVLCSILADPSDASLPQFGYNKVDLPAILQGNFLNGNFLRKLREAPRKLRLYHENLGRLAGLLLRRYVRREPALDQLRSHISRVGELLACYEGPCLLIFGEKDCYWFNFLNRVNPNDQLGLSSKRQPPGLVVVKDGDHTFASREQTAEMIRETLSWLDSFRHGQLPVCANPYRGNKYAVSLTPVAD